jgi:hypothetical protein
MQKQTTTIIISIVLIIIAFFGGKAYGSSHAAPARAAGQFAQGSFSGMAGRTGGGRGMGGGIGGTVLSIGTNSITVSLPNNNGSKIILFSPSTTVLKSTAGTTADITVGANITAIGATNPDGSISANTISIRPTSAQGYGGAQPAGMIPPAK